MYSESVDKAKYEIKKILGERKNLKIARAPGRVNIIGEHTDYNNGLALPAAIDKYLYFAYSENGTATINAHAVDINEKISFKISELKKTDYSWANYLIGILLEFSKLGITLKGFDCVITSEVPIGAGMSSSAAFDCAVLKGLDALYQTNLENWDLVSMAQNSSHSFLGIKSGILDQFASLFGKKDTLMFLDCANNEFEYIPVLKSDYVWMLINSCVKHTHLNSEYNTRVKECQSALASVQKTNRHISHLSAIRDIEQIENVDFENAVIENRAQFIIEENQRVRSFIQAMEANDFNHCGELLYQSHEGLSKKYQVSCDELDFLVDILSGNNNVLGSRMMGGGFGGCTINLIDSKSMETIQEEVSNMYFNKYGIKPEYYTFNISEGAGLIQ